MEWDIGALWYRPTRVCHAVSGSDWGWRNGSAKWPVYFADTLPPVVNIGLGSPTGITFGYGAKFPAKYQNALFICDWTYGKMYAVSLASLTGASYTGTAEEFMPATPLPLTDAIINPHDGAMYFPHRRAQNPVGPVSADVRRQGIDRTGRSHTSPTPRTSAISQRSLKRCTWAIIPTPSKRPGPT